MSNNLKKQNRLNVIPAAKSSKPAPEMVLNVENMLKHRADVFGGLQNLRTDQDTDRRAMQAIQDRIAQRQTNINANEGAVIMCNNLLRQMGFVDPELAQPAPAAAPAAQPEPKE